MKKKIFKISLLCLVFFLVGLTCYAGSTHYVPEVGIPGIVGAGESLIFNGLNDFITRLLVFVYRASFIIAFFMLVYTGFLYIFAKDSPVNVRKAMESLKYLGIGIGLILFSYVILYTINPQLVQLSLFDFNINQDDVVAILPEAINKLNVKDMMVQEGISSENAILVATINEMVKEGHIGGADYKVVISDLQDNSINVKSEIKTTLSHVLSWYLENNHRKCGPLDIGPIQTSHANDPSGCSCHISASAIDVYVLNDVAGCNEDLYQFLLKNENLFGIDVIDERGSKQSTYSTSSHFHIQTKKCSVEYGKCINRK
ncbi:MAG: pilin [Candidatus Pacebacteria bacterium]|nr:pilin [Candidatus Paceibacterota bacterium]